MTAGFVIGTRYAFVAASVLGAMLLPDRFVALGQDAAGAEQIFAVATASVHETEAELFYVVDGAAMSANPGVNPSLTISAPSGPTSRRNMRSIAAQMRNSTGDAR